MTQGAIDLVQAELTPPPVPSLLLLQDMPHSAPKLVAKGCVTPKVPAHKVISDYTWWDDGKSVCISVPTDVYLPSTCPLSQQAQCSISDHQLQIVLTVSGADGQLMQHRLNIPQLGGAVQPGRSSCVLGGHSVQLSDIAPAPCQTGRQASETSCQLTQGKATCDNAFTQVQPCKSSSTSLQQRLHTSAVRTQSGAKQQSKHMVQGKLQPPCPAVHPCNAEHSPNALDALCHTKQKSGLLVTLCKADPRKAWGKLMGPAPVSPPGKQPPPSPESMAAMRRSLIRQRQHHQAEQTENMLPCVALPPPTMSVDPANLHPAGVVHVISEYVEKRSLAALGHTIASPGAALGAAPDTSKCRQSERLLLEHQIVDTKVLLSMLVLVLTKLIQD